MDSFNQTDEEGSGLRISRSPGHEKVFVYQRLSDAELKKMYAFFEAGILCDVTLVAGNETIRAHRVVLSAVSEYFETMFTSNLREATSDTVNLQDVDGHALRLLVMFAYTGKIYLNEDTVENILLASSLLRFEDVLQACCGYLIRLLNPTNCIGFANIGDRLSCFELKRVARSYILEHFVKVIECDEYLQITVKELFWILSSDDLNVSSELMVYKALMKWVNYEQEKREPYLSRLMQKIRLPLIPLQTLNDLVVPEVGLFVTSLINEALDYHRLPYSRAEMAISWITPRKSTLECLIAVAGISAESDSTNFPLGDNLYKYLTSGVEIYYPRRAIWNNCRVMPTRNKPFLQHAVATFGDYVFVAGGRDGLRTMNYAERYNFYTGAWFSIADMVTPRHGLGLVAIEPHGPLYAVGGHDGWGFLNSVERWDPQTGTWSIVEPLSRPRSTVGVAVLNNKVYAVGGRDNTTCLSSVEMYDPETNKWTQCASMSKRRGGVAVAVANNFLYAFGGYDFYSDALTKRRHSSFERYDPRIDKWQVIGNLSTARDAIGAAVVGNCILLAGGFDGEKTLQSVDMFNPLNNEWKELPRMITARAGPFLASFKVEKHVMDDNENG